MSQTPLWRRGLIDRRIGCAGVRPILATVAPLRAVLSRSSAGARPPQLVQAVGMSAQHIREVFRRDATVATGAGDTEIIEIGSGEG